MNIRRKFIPVENKVCSKENGEDIPSKTEKKIAKDGQNPL
jgi:hypothetical protein